MTAACSSSTTSLCTIDAKLVGAMPLSAVAVHIVDGVVLENGPAPVERLLDGGQMPLRVSGVHDEHLADCAESPQCSVSRRSRAAGDVVEFAALPTRILAGFIPKPGHL